MYTLTIDLDGIPGWQRATVTSVLDEHGVTHRAWGKNMLDVRGGSEEGTTVACTAALQRVGKRLEDVKIDLF